MPIFSDAWRALRRNWLWAGAYVGASLGAGAAFKVYSDWSRTVVGDGVVPPKIALLGLSADLLYLAILAAFTAVIFAEMGKEMDRPLWKCGGAGEALRRYFVPWFLIALINITTGRLMIQAAQAGDGSLALLLEFCRMCLIMLSVPVGACIMYHRGLVWKELPDALAPLTRLLSPTLGVLLLGMFQWALWFTLILAIPDEMRGSTLLLVLIEAPLVLIDCYVFCAVWHICMLDRDTQSEDFGNDFDF